MDTLRGKAWLVIPPGTQHGDSLELAGAGIEKLLGEQAGKVQTECDGKKTVKGSHYFEVSVRVPIQISNAERELLQRLKVADQPLSQAKDAA